MPTSTLKNEKTTRTLKEKFLNVWNRYQKVPVFIVFFALFWFLVTTSGWEDKLNVQIGQPSPLLITAPYNKDIEQWTRYSEDLAKATQSVSPVYMVDEQVIGFLQADLEDVFKRIREVESSGLTDREKNNLLRRDVFFASLGEDVLSDLYVGADSLERIQKDGSLAILKLAWDLETGAKTVNDLPNLHAQIREEINKLEIPDVYKIFFESFVDAKMTAPTLTENKEETKKRQAEAAAKVQIHVKSYVAGEKIVGPSEIITNDIYDVLMAYGLIHRKSQTTAKIGIAIEILLGMILLLVFIYRYHQSIFDQQSRIVLIGLIIGFLLLLTRLLLGISVGGSLDLVLIPILLIPVAWATMTITILLGVHIAVATSAIIAFFMLLMIDPTTNANAFSFVLVLFSMVGAIGGIISVSSLEQRLDLARAGLYVAAINIIGTIGLSLVLDYSLKEIALHSVAAAVSGIISAVFLIGTLPLFERAFQITSTVRLLELANPNSVLLKKLLVDAPGTYHHSVMVGNLAEAVAEQVGADPILVRVGALYHDIGKLKRPYFFIENQIGRNNPHDKITSTLSALIIISHIKDGLEMAEKYKLPDNIKNIITQHHGDSLVGYFYAKALAENPDIPEDAFRYDGPRPRSKEAALVLLADNVEAVIRSHRGNTAARMEALVHKIIKNKVDEGMLSESELTYKDLHTIAEAFVKVLSGIFHSRIEYPEMPKRSRIWGLPGKEEQEQKKFGKKDDTSPEKSPANGGTPRAGKQQWGPKAVADTETELPPTAKMAEASEHTDRKPEANGHRESAEGRELEEKEVLEQEALERQAQAWVKQRAQKIAAKRTSEEDGGEVELEYDPEYAPNAFGTGTVRAKSGFTQQKSSKTVGRPETASQNMVPASAPTRLHSRKKKRVQVKNKEK